MSTNGYFVISLDFELYWGMFDKVTLETYGGNIKGAHSTIPQMLSLFTSHNIHATWATVGMLMHRNKEELLASLPPIHLQPRYKDMRISSYEHIKNAEIKNDEETDVYHFGKSLVEKIIATPNQELGSHTYSHYYCLDGSENGEAIFAADCEAFANVAQSFGVPITSIVFPRNQTTSDALVTCKAHGITTYRGTPEHFLYTGKKEQEQTNIVLRMLRLLDAYINISGHHTFTFSTVNCTKSEGLKNVQGSWFLRPYSKTLKVLERLKLQRIKNSMTHAAKNNEIFHLWWHPHNFGINRKENIQNLLEIIEHFKKLEAQYGMQSANMRDIANLPS